MMNWRKKWNSVSLSKRIGFSFIVLCTLLVCGVTLVVNVTYRRLMDEQLRERTAYENQLMVQQLERLSESVNSCCNNVILNLNVGFRQYPTVPEFTGYSTAEVSRMFVNGLISNLLLFGEVERISVVLRTGALYSGSRANMRESFGNDQDVYEFLREEGVGTKGCWYYGLDKRFGSQLGSISYVKGMRYIDRNEDVGYVIICIAPEFLESMMKFGKSNGYIQYALMGEDGYMLLPDEMKFLEEEGILSPADILQRQEKESFPIEQQGRQYYCEKMSLAGNGGWVLISIIDRDIVQKGVNLITGSVLLAGLFLTLAADILILLMAERISRPIRQMARHMVSFSDHLPETLPPYQGRDEIGILTENFNTMITKNRELIEKVYEQQRQKRHFELALLQAQIKPHFLYNSLDSAYCLVADRKEEQAQKILKLLADYYRSVLNRGEEWISVAKELEAVEKYIQIQQIRYRGLFTYEIDVAYEIMQMRIPKLTLQPLVENAIYHGIKPLGKDGRIRITGEMDGNWAYIKVADNGIGFAEESFYRVLEQGRADSDGDSLGLKNSARRIAMFYNSDSGLSLEKGENGETVLIIRICLGTEDIDV